MGRSSKAVTTSSPDVITRFCCWSAAPATSAATATLPNRVLCIILNRKNIFNTICRQILDLLELFPGGGGAMGSNLFFIHLISYIALKLVFTCGDENQCWKVLKADVVTGNRHPTIEFWISGVIAVRKQLFGRMVYVKVPLNCCVICAPWGWFVGIKPAAVATMLNFDPRSVVEHTPRDPEVAGSNRATFPSLIL